MEKWLEGFLSGFKTAFYIDQVFTVVMLFFLGLVFLMLIKRRISGVMDLLLSYPLGLSIYVITGMLLLILNIEFKFKNLILAVAILLIFFYVISSIFKASSSVEDVSDISRDKTPLNSEVNVLPKKSISINKKSFLGFKLPVRKKAGMVLLAVVLISCIACLGVFSVIIFQDSMYRYSLYPRAIVRYGHLKREYNVFLTDVGLGSAVLGTLPYIFGFNETFGIQTALNLNFLILFGYAAGNAYHKEKLVGQSFPDKAKTIGRFSVENKELVATVLVSVLLLVTAMPFFITSKWAISNMYFMEYLFICVYASIYYKEEPYIPHIKGQMPKEQKTYLFRGTEAESILILSVLFIMLSSLRMEGMVFLLLLLLSCLILGFKGSLVANLILLPCILIYGAYYYRIFKTMFIDAPYTFLTEKKAVLQLLAMGAVYLYLLFSGSGLFIAVRKHLKSVILVGLLLINLCLFFADKALYLADIKACYDNLTGMSGWGVFPVFCVSALALLLLLCIIDRRKPSLSFMDFMVLSFLLVTIIAGFARGDALQVSIGDSGNRVLLQIVPLAVFAIEEHFINSIVS